MFNASSFLFVHIYFSWNGLLFEWIKFLLYDVLKRWKVWKVLEPLALMTLFYLLLITCVFVSLFYNIIIWEILVKNKCIPFTCEFGLNLGVMQLFIAKSCQKEIQYSCDFQLLSTKCQSVNIVNFFVSQ